MKNPQTYKTFFKEKIREEKVKRKNTWGKLFRSFLLCIRHFGSRY